MCEDRTFIGLEKLRDFVTSCEKPLVIKIFSCWIQYEDDVSIEQYCSLFTPILNLVNHSPDINSVAYHKGRKFGLCNPIMNLHTAIEEPLVIKKPKVPVFINDQKLSKCIINCANIQQVIAVASKDAKVALIPAAYNKDGKVIKNLDSFILSTTEEQSLYLRKLQPDKPHYSHSHSISDASRNYPKEIPVCTLALYGNI